MSKKVKITYIEIMIIAVVLGVTARLMRPAFTGAITESRTAVLVDGLMAMRANLNVYQTWHGGCLPPAESSESFKTAVTKKLGYHEPYIKNIPVNPFNGLNTIRFDGEPAGSGNAGWRFDTVTGAFQADNDPDYATL